MFSVIALLPILFIHFPSSLHSCSFSLLCWFFFLLMFFLNSVWIMEGHKIIFFLSIENNRESLLVSFACQNKLLCLAQKMPYDKRLADVSCEKTRSWNVPFGKSMVMPLLAVVLITIWCFPYSFLSFAFLSSICQTPCQNVKIHGCNHTLCLMQSPCVFSSVRTFHTHTVVISKLVSGGEAVTFLSSGGLKQC